MTLYDKLNELNKSDMLPLHMPGHKRSNVIPELAGIYGLDITEIDGFDDLHEPDGIIAEIEHRAAKLYGADRAWISVNGSSAALEAAILAVCKAGDEIIIPRASHKSIYHAIEIGRLKPVYIGTEMLRDTTILLPPAKDTIREACEAHPAAKCVVITSPTYEGLIADISGIADTVHSFGKVLIADSAHGAHLGFGEQSSAIQAGADISVVSLHKMLPAPTQTALLLAGSQSSTGSDAERISVFFNHISHYMQVFQSSSPSYILMAGIEACVGYMEDRLAEDLSEAVRSAARFREELRGLKYLDVSTENDADPFKVVIRSLNSRFSGRDLYMGLLQDHHIQCEMYGADYALAMFSPVDRDASFDRLRDALIALDEVMAQGPAVHAAESAAVFRAGIYGLHIPEAVMMSAEAYEKASECLPLDEALIGRISASYICVYPPGIPVMVPGEVIDEDVCIRIKSGLENGLHITGLREGLVPVLI